MLRTTLLAAALVLPALALAPPAGAAPGETCTVSLHTWSATVLCTGILYEFAHLTWCPNVSDDITCLSVPLLTCTVSTSRPFLLCPLA